MMDTIRSTETPVLTTATQRHIPEDGILHVRDTFLRNVGWIFKLSTSARNPSVISGISALETTHPLLEVRRVRELVGSRLSQR
jgi:hypothetical protein